MKKFKFIYCILPLMLVLLIFTACSNENESVTKRVNERENNSNLKGRSICGETNIKNYLNSETLTHSGYNTSTSQLSQFCSQHLPYGTVQFSTDISPGNYLGGSCCIDEYYLDLYVSDMVALINTSLDYCGYNQVPEIVVEWKVEDLNGTSPDCDIDWIVTFYCCSDLQ